MKRRIKITKLPNYEQGSEVSLGGGNTKPGYSLGSAENSAPDLNVSSFISPVPRDQANIEAEKGETMITPMGDDARTKTLPKTFMIGGKKHHSGGTPLNVPDGTFVFSDHLKEKNQDIHSFFNKKPKKSGYTYAELSKPYMVNKDLKHLISDSSDRISQNTAKMNIQNKLEKLSLLSLLQESKKGFGDEEEFNIPEVGMIHLEKTGLDISQAIQPYIDAINPQAQQQAPVPQMKRGGLVKMQTGGGVKGLKPGHRIDRTTGEIIDKKGKVVGIVTAGGDAVETKKTKKASIPDDAIVVSRKDFATDAEYIAARDEAFEKAEGATIYTQALNGSYSKVGTRNKTFDPYEGDLLETIFNKNQNVADQYYYLEQKFNTPEAKKALQEKAIAAYENKANVRGMSQSQINAAVKRLKDDPDLAYNQFMDMQQRNMSLIANEYEVSTFKNAPGKGGVSNKDFEEAYKKIGLKTPSKEDAALQQAVYIGYKDLLKDRDDGIITDKNLLASLKNFNITQVGKSDDKITGDKEGSISMIDGIYTNTTAGEIAGITSNPEIFEEELDAEDAIDTKTINGVTDQTPYGWRAPDVKRLMSATRNLSSDVKEQPWAKIPDYHIPNVYLDSPDERAFNERGQIKALEDTLSTYATPGTLAASASALSGAGNIGKYISQVGRENKDRVNQHSVQAASILNAAAGERAQIATSLHDKRALVNEKSRAFKREATKQWDDSFDWGYNKAAELAMVNARTPNYNVDPWSGKIYHTPGGPLTPTDGNTNTMMDKIAKYKEIYPNVSDDVIYKAVKEEMGIVDQTPSYLNYGSAATQPS
tara:strand:+ start:827 stop:3280 length:2454 start_codon:yes stop_codon:yes gene_type:complete